MALCPDATSCLSAAQQNYFKKAWIAYNPASNSTTINANGLSQFCYPEGGTCLSMTAQDNTTNATGGAAGEALVEFLRGERSNELGFFRERKHVLGDIVSSEARYVKTPLFNYTDTNYGAYKSLQTARRGAVYVASNDGMLHAFDAETGKESWAYVPELVLSDLYRLADRNYSQQHQFFVDGTPETGDICPNAPLATCSASQWKTIIVGGLNRGGKGYYALDITDPANPKVLWEFTHATMGYSYGNPRITKLKSGKWVVLLTSGYNNADGKGYLYVLDANSGSLIGTPIATTVTAGTDSGLAKISAHAPTAETNNTTLAVYGGDLLGNLWRFDINNDIGSSGIDAQRLVTFADAGGKLQPITTKPVVTTVSLSPTESYPIVYVGTGSYLGLSDIGNQDYQSMYAVKDQYSKLTSYNNPRATGSGFHGQKIESASCTTEPNCTPGESIRKTSPGYPEPVSWLTDNGWYVDFLTAGERSNTDPSLALGSLIFTTNTPNKASAEPCGEPSADTSSSWLYALDYQTGGAVGGSAGLVAVSLGNVIATRPVLIRTESGEVFAMVRTSGTSSSSGSSGGTEGNPAPAGFYPGSAEGSKTQIRKPPVNLSGGSSRRVSWREITTD